MIHYSCDLCGRPLDREEPRYEVRIEIRFAHDGLDPGGLPPDLLDEDGLDLLEAFGEVTGTPAEDLFRTLRYDLCESCRAHYLRDPLSRARPRLRHLEN